MKYIVFRDGDQWCATLEDFKNLQESSAGFGSSPNEAISNLQDEELARLEKAALTKKEPQ